MCKCNKRTCATILATFFVIVALALAILVSFWRQETFMITVNVSHFFDIMLPTLAVGALIKYLFTHHCCCGSHSSCCKSSGGEKDSSCDKEKATEKTCCGEKQSA